MAASDEGDGLAGGMAIRTRHYICYEVFLLLGPNT